MLLRNLLLSGLALGSYLLTSGSIRSQLPPDPGDENHEKMAYLAEHAPGATAILFGTSAILHGVIPELVDEVVGEFEPDFRCINAGVSGLRDFEADQFVRDVLALPGVDPTWIFVQPAEWRADLSEPYRDTDRTLRWHNLRQTTGAMLVSLEGLQPALKGEVNWAMFHFRKFCHRFSNYGQIERLVRGLGNHEFVPRFEASTLVERRGFVSVEEAVGRVGELHSKRFLGEIDEYERRVAELATRKARPPTQASRTLFRRQRAWLERQVPHPIYLMPPYPYGGLIGGQLDREGEIPHGIDFVQPLVYPELYAVEYRYEPYHTNLAGAEVFSRLLGERIVEELREIRAEQIGESSSSR